MNVLESLKIRRSIRRYQDRQVEEDKVLNVLEAARLSPSAVNFQPWDFIVVKGKIVKDQLSKAYNRSWFSKAPIVIVVCVNPQKAWRRNDGEEFWKVDGAIAGQSMVLAAASEGLGTCWICAFDEKKCKEALRIPSEVRVVAMITLGYSAESKGPVVERKTLAEILHYDRW